ncbi:SH3 domain-containing protein [Roseobacter sp. CCS2]|uniref:SH3 domain-containing protein n=1 Tax=Roseobacter sp. CCS2 TaxID=391593 RepID=UPI0000F40370|nr:SH3 domain-containing protein [Roseobacter sp. CCS2]EBA13017.1 hypothetical protein RCCS2_04009 [Roseobacter sp. CCS2]
MRLILTLLACLWAHATYADQTDPPLPALYAVTGVAADDVLNVRAAPNGSAAVIGTLAHDAKDVEVVTLSREGRWARVNTGESAGWTAMQFLAAQDQRYTPLGLPEGLTCFGTEPFWSMTFGESLVLDYASPGRIVRHAIASLSPNSNTVSQTDLRYRFVWGSRRDPVTAHILPGQCNDGMSDRAYGLYYIDDQGPRIGCCSLN